MRDKASADFSFDVKIERTSRARLRQARLERLESEEEQLSIHSGSDSGSEREVEIMGENPPPPDGLLGDYGGANAPIGRLTIVNQLVNMGNFQLHPSTINQLERKNFTGKVNEDANKHLQRFLTMSNTLKIDGHTEEAKKLRMFLFTLAEEGEECFYSLSTGSIASWEEMEKAFLNEYFPTSVFL